MYTEGDKNNISLEDQLVDNLMSDDLVDLTSEIGEFTLDRFLDDSFLKDVPIIGTVSKSLKLISDIRQAAFLKKVYKFLFELKDIPRTIRISYIEKLETNGIFRGKVGEKLITILDRLDEIEKSQILGKLFKASINSQISHFDFMKLAHIVERSFIGDLKKLKEYPRIDKSTQEHFVTIGIMSFELQRSLDDWFNSNNSIEEWSKSGEKALTYKLNPYGSMLIDYGLK